MELKIGKLQDLMDLFHLGKLARAVITTVDLHIFEAIGNDECNLYEIVERTKADEETVKFLLTLMVHVELIYYKNGFFSNSYFALQYLTNKKNNIIDLLKYNLSDYQCNSSMGQAELETMVRAMHQGNEYIACFLSRLVRTQNKICILDVGCGSGIFTSYILKYCPKAVADCIDFTDIIQIAARYLNDPNIKDRINFIAGDFINMNLHNKYDIVLFSNVLHFYDRYEITLIIRKFKSCLTGGGKIVICDFFTEHSNFSKMLFSLEWFKAGRTFPTLEQMIKIMKDEKFDVEIHTNEAISASILICKL